MPKFKVYFFGEIKGIDENQLTFSSNSNDIYYCRCDGSCEGHSYVFLENQIIGFLCDGICKIHPKEEEV